MEKSKQYKRLLALLTGGVMSLSSCGTVGSDENVKGDDFESSIEHFWDEFSETDFKEVEFDMKVIDSKTGELVTTTQCSTTNFSTGTVCTDEVSDYITTESINDSTSLIPNISDQVTIENSNTVTTVSTETFSQVISDDVNINVDDFYSYPEVDENDSMSLCEYNKSKYFLEFGYGRYEFKDGDTIDSICEKLCLNVDELKMFNSYLNTLHPGSYIKYPARFEYYNATKGEDIRSISVIQGIPEAELRDLNNFDISTNYISDDGAILLHIFPGDAISNDTAIGSYRYDSYGNKIWGDKFLYPTGYSGASGDLLVLSNSRFISGMNGVSHYIYDGSGSYDSELICSNASDIELIEGIPVIYTRTQEEIDSIASLNNISVDTPDYDKLATVYFDDVIVGYDKDGRKFVTYDDKIKALDYLSFEGNAQKIK